MREVLYGILLDCKCLSDSNGDAWREEYEKCSCMTKSN